MRKSSILIRKFILNIIIKFLFVSICLGCSFSRIVILKDPLTPKEHLNLGVVYERKGELDLAIHEYQLALKKLPIANLYLGNAYFLKKEYEIAEKYYKKAIEEIPFNANAHNNLAWLYYIKQENLDEAESLVLKAIEMDPQKKDLYLDTLEKIQNLKKDKY